MKKILITILCLVTFATPVFAQNTTAGNTSTNGNGTTNSTTNSTTAAEAREKRITIRTQLQELKTLRATLRTRLESQQKIMLQYKEKDELTEEERLEVKAMIQTMLKVREKLGEAYQNAAKALSDYKKDSSESKLTGLDLVIESQRQRIQLFEDAIAELE
jgi:hypothetical protein